MACMNGIDVTAGVGVGVVVATVVLKHLAVLAYLQHTAQH